MISRKSNGAFRILCCLAQINIDHGHADPSLFIKCLEDFREDPLFLDYLFSVYTTLDEGNDKKRNKLAKVIRESPWLDHPGKEQTGLSKSNFRNQWTIGKESGETALTEALFLYLKVSQRSNEYTFLMDLVHRFYEKFGEYTIELKSRIQNGPDYNRNINDFELKISEALKGLSQPVSQITDDLQGLHWIYYARPSRDKVLNLLKNPLNIKDPLPQKEDDIQRNEIDYCTVDDDFGIRVYRGEMWRYKDTFHLNFNLCHHKAKQIIQFALMPIPDRAPKIFVGQHLSYPLANSDYIYSGLRIMKKAQPSETYEAAIENRGFLHKYDSSNRQILQVKSDSSKIVEELKDEEFSDYKIFTTLRRSLHNSKLERDQYKTLEQTGEKSREDTMSVFNGHWFSLKLVGDENLEETYFDISYWKITPGLSGIDYILELNNRDSSSEPFKGTMELRDRTHVSMVVACEHNKNFTYHEIAPTGKRKSFIARGIQMIDDVSFIKGLSNGPYNDSIYHSREILIRLKDNPSWITENIKNAKYRISRQDLSKLVNQSIQAEIYHFLSPPTHHAQLLKQHSFRVNYQGALNQFPATLHVVRRTDTHGNNAFLFNEIIINSDWTVRFEYEGRRQKRQYKGEVISGGTRFLTLQLARVEKNGVDFNDTVIISVNLSTKKEVYPGSALVTLTKHSVPAAYNALFSTKKEVLEDLLSETADYTIRSSRISMGSEYKPHMESDDQTLDKVRYASFDKYSLARWDRDSDDINSGKFVDLDLAEVRSHVHDYLSGICATFDQYIRII